MATLKNTLEMGNLMFLLLVIFLVPRCYCNILAVNKTGLLFDEIDNLLVQTTEEHVAMYATRWNCSKSSHALQEKYRSNQNGILLLQIILDRYNLLTQLYNSGCKKQENQNMSGKSSTCEPFGCHKVEIRTMPDQLWPNDSNIGLRTNNVNINNITILVNLPTTSEKPSEKSTEKPTETPTKKPKKKPVVAHDEESDEDSEEEPTKPWSFLGKWVPLATWPYGYSRSSRNTSE